MRFAFQTTRSRRPVMAAAMIVVVTAPIGSHADAQFGRRGRQPEPPKKQRLLTPLSGTLKQFMRGRDIDPSGRRITMDNAKAIDEWLTANGITHRTIDLTVGAT